jgi:hypothetical protein
MYNKRDLEDLTFHIPPSCQGQHMEYAYAIDPAGLFRRVTDLSIPSDHAERVSYDWVSWDQFEDGGESVAEPWNGEPEVDEDLWVRL